MDALTLIIAQKKHKLAKTKLAHVDHRTGGQSLRVQMSKQFADHVRRPMLDGYGWIVGQIQA